MEFGVVSRRPQFLLLMCDLTMEEKAITCMAVTSIKLRHNYDPGILNTLQEDSLFPFLVLEEIGPRARDDPVLSTN